MSCSQLPLCQPFDQHHQTRTTQPLPSQPTTHSVLLKQTCALAGAARTPGDGNESETESLASPSLGSPGRSANNLHRYEAWLGFWSPELDSITSITTLVLQVATYASLKSSSSHGLHCRKLGHAATARMRAQPRGVKASIHAITTLVPCSAGIQQTKLAHWTLSRLCACLAHCPPHSTQSLVLSAPKLCADQHHHERPPKHSCQAILMSGQRPDATACLACLSPHIWPSKPVTNTGVMLVSC